MARLTPAEKARRAQELDEIAADWRAASATYQPAEFWEIDPNSLQKFKTNLTASIKEDDSASLTGALLTLKELSFYKQLNRKEAEILSYRDALIERFGYDNFNDYPPIKPFGHFNYSDPLVEALYHAADAFGSHMYWVRGMNERYKPADHVNPPRLPLKIKRS